MKKFIHFYKIFFYSFIFSFLILPKIAFSESSLDEKVKKITLQLRCMTCQNQTVYDSESDFSKNIIKIIENMIQQGKSENEIKSFLVERYGEYILFKPKFDIKNLILWLFPFVLFLSFLILFVFRLKKK